MGTTWMYQLWEFPTETIRNSYLQPSGLLCSCCRSLITARGLKKNHAEAREVPGVANPTSSPISKRNMKHLGPGVFFFIISPVLPNKNLHHHHHQNHHRHLTLIRLPLWATEPNSNFDHRSMLPPEMESCTFYQEFKPPLKDINIWVGFHKGKLFQLKWLEAISQKRSKNKLFGKLKHQLNRDIHVSFCKDVLFLLGNLGVQFWSAETQHTWKTMSRCFVSETLPKLMSSCYFVHSIKTCSKYFQIL